MHSRVCGIPMHFQSKDHYCLELAREPRSWRLVGQHCALGYALALLPAESGGSSEVVKGMS